jgi:WD40 repeat protein
MYLIGARPKGIDIWDYDSKQLLTTLVPQSLEVDDGYSSHYSCSDRFVAVVTGDLQSVVVWDISSITDCKLLHEFSGPDRGEFIGSLCFLRSDYHLMVAFCSKIVSFDAVNGSVIHIVNSRHNHFMQPVGDGVLTASRNGSVSLWTSDLTESRLVELDAYIGGICVNPCEDTLVASTYDKGFVFLNLINLERIAPPRLTESDPCLPFELTSTNVRDLHFDATGTKLLVRGAKSKMCVIDVLTGTLLFEMCFSGPVCCGYAGESIYGVSDEGIGVCWNSQTGFETDCPFTFQSACDYYYSRYSKLSIFSPPTSILL